MRLEPQAKDDLDAFGPFRIAPGPRRALASNGAAAALHAPSLQTRAVPARELHRSETELIATLRGHLERAPMIETLQLRATVVTMPRAGACRTDWARTTIRTCPITSPHDSRRRRDLVRKNSPTENIELT
jgi:hypothetical protein